MITVAAESLFQMADVIDRLAASHLAEIGKNDTPSINWDAVAALERNESLFTVVARDEKGEVKGYALTTFGMPIFSLKLEANTFVLFVAPEQRHGSLAIRMLKAVMGEIERRGFSTRWGLTTTYTAANKGLAPFAKRLGMTLENVTYSKEMEGA